MKKEEASSLWLITHSYNVGVPREPFLLFIFGGHYHLLDRQTNIARTMETYATSVTDALTSLCSSTGQQ